MLWGRQILTALRQTEKCKHRESPYFLSGAEKTWQLIFQRRLTSWECTSSLAHLRSLWESQENLWIFTSTAASSRYVNNLSYMCIPTCVTTILQTPCKQSHRRMHRQGCGKGQCLKQNLFYYTMSLCLSFPHRFSGFKLASAAAIIWPDFLLRHSSSSIGILGLE